MSEFPSLPHLVVIPVFPGINALDVTGPAEVLALADRLLPAGRAGYDVRLRAERIGLVETFSGVPLYVGETLRESPVRPDTVLVPGRVDLGPHGPVPRVDDAVVAWLREAGPQAGRVASVCAGAHVTAAAGLLDGHRATTHWATADRLASDHPAVEVDPDPVFVRSGRMWTSAGLTASMDLTLALVAEDHGDDLALDIARIMVMYLQRPGGQSQFSVPLAHRPGGRADLRSLRRWIADHLDADLSVPVLADRLAMSERHFARIFRVETGTTPGAYVEELRLEAARRLLERTDQPVPGIARACGFGSAETVHRVFRDHLGTTPAEYRRRFRVTGH
ncbi:GlxA family transcriptional regulator [Streptomyces sp. CBMA156]|uniref:GlxA family transcriptional regulator n=1 Tax=Streptomyces sp. CBMA156 TaxID=1930280 RepID=UPI001661B838|nr:GlxA family transcriptional regulator [Streptomyces sp. CBMA156]MBD0673527.1 AraC family transcriptional regulator [Streptomyces sp. CBMA156]